MLGADQSGAGGGARSLVWSVVVDHLREFRAVARDDDCGDRERHQHHDTDRHPQQQPVGDGPDVAGGDPLTEALAGDPLSAPWRRGSGRLYNAPVESHTMSLGFTSVRRPKWPRSSHARSPSLPQGPFCRKWLLDIKYCESPHPRRVHRSSSRRGNILIMVQKRIVELIDDLDGGAAEENVTFGIDGKVYELDLSSANADALRAVLAPFISAGRRSSIGSRLTGPAAADVDIAAVRQWAVANGYAVNTRGRIPAPILAAYNAR